MLESAAAIGPQGWHLAPDDVSQPDLRREREITNVVLVVTIRAIEERNALDEDIEKGLHGSDPTGVVREL